MKPNAAPGSFEFYAARSIPEMAAAALPGRPLRAAGWPRSSRGSAIRGLAWEAPILPFRAAGPGSGGRRQLPDRHLLQQRWLTALTCQATSVQSRYQSWIQKMGLPTDGDSTYALGEYLPGILLTPSRPRGRRRSSRRRHHHRRRRNPGHCCGSRKVGLAVLQPTAALRGRKKYHVADCGTRRAI